MRTLAWLILLSVPVACGVLFAEHTTHVCIGARCPDFSDDGVPQPSRPRRPLRGAAMIRRALWDQTAIDYAALADAMLDAVKQQARVEHNRHDDLIGRDIKWAIATVQRRANIDVFPATYRVAASLAGGFCDVHRARMACRVTRCHSTTCEQCACSTLPTSISPAIGKVTQAQFGGNADAYAFTPSGAALTGATSIELDVGVDDVEKLDPAVEAAVHKLAASHYEHREANLPVSESSFDPELIQLWRPSA